MICYQDKTFCSRSCLNLKCYRNQKTINKEQFDKVGLPLCIGDMKTDTCGFIPDKVDNVHD